MNPFSHGELKSGNYANHMLASQGEGEPPNSPPTKLFLPRIWENNRKDSSTHFRFLAVLGLV